MIIRNTNTKIHPNFSEKEFYSSSPDIGLSHFLDDRVINAVFFLREYYESAIRINSSTRSKTHNAFIGGHPNSKHVTGEALDFGFISPEIHAQFLIDIQDELSFVFKSLREIGISAFGLYDTFIHIDCGDYDRQNSASLKTDMFGKWKLWNNTSQKKNLFRSLMNKTA